ncbi:MAG: ATP-binding protein [Methanomicrobiaceae archaeon]|nr:ATP-binding protein [Methanomicrobiaceae archaeon]
MPSEGFFSFHGDEGGLSEQDFTRIWVIASFVLISVLVTIYAFSVPPSDIYAPMMFLFPQLYYIPIVLVSIWYPRYGLQCTVLLVAAFLAITAYYTHLGSAFDPFISGVNAAMYLWVVAATTLMAREGGLLNIKYWNLFRNADAGMFVCDLKSGEILDVNPKLAGMLEYSVEDLKGMHAQNLWEKGEEGFALLGECRDGVLVAERKTRFVSKSGTVVTTQITCKKNAEEPVIECTVIDISDQEKEMATLEASKDRLQNLVNSSQDLIFMQDPEGRFVQFHWAKAEEFALDASTMIGKTAFDLFPAAVAEELALYAGGVMQGGSTVTTTFKATLGGTDHLFSLILGPVYDADGSTLGVVGTMRDVTGMTLEERNLIQMERELDRWRNFINTAAHELRTPLQPILGYLHMILEDPSSFALDSETTKLLNLCLENVERERRVVDRMLELGIMDSCKVHLHLSEIDLRQLIVTVIRIGGYDTKAEIHLPLPPDVSITGDRDRLFHVMDGLIANAIQYNRDPKKVWITYEENGENHYIRVRDNGIGIATGALRSIFEPFYLADMDNLSRQYGRMGLGLSIAQRYMEMHGGRITVSSEVGVGSVFTIRIPKEVPHEA